MTEYSKSTNFFLFVMLVLPAAFIIVGLSGISKVNKRIRAIMKLNKTGKLIKNGPYYIEDSDTRIKGVLLPIPVIDYILPSGTVIKLYGDKRNYKKQFDEDGFVDLLIDENDLSNYFIDFEINRLSGNSSKDYYKPDKKND